MTNDRCPTCKRKYAQHAVRKYTNAEARAAGRAAATEATVRRRFAEDLRTVHRYVPEVFESTDVASACRLGMRSYSEHMAVLSRGLRFGAFVEIEPRFTPTGVIRRRYRKVAHGEAVRLQRPEEETKAPA